MKEKWKVSKIVLVLAIIICLLVAFAFTCGFGIYVLTKDWHTPLQYCLWEIQTNQNYDCELSYIYEEIKPRTEPTDKRNEIYSYYITCFTDDRKGEWYCFIECRIPFYIRGIGTPKGYTQDNIVLIDCDLAFETFYFE